MAVCEKLRQENSWLETGHRLSVGWVVAHYRKHLAACPSCGSTCKHVEAVIDALDHELLGCLGELIPLCLECLKCDTERARRLLSNERKAAGLTFFRVKKKILMLSSRNNGNSRNGFVFLR